jgi:hypothetical protein
VCGVCGVCVWRVQHTSTAHGTWHDTHTSHTHTSHTHISHTHTRVKGVPEREKGAGGEVEEADQLWSVPWLMDRTWCGCG